MTSVTLSVALCTRNAAAFLGPQLDSILTQSRLPDELVVGDEASSDASHEMLQDFARRAPFPVRIIRNPQPLGVAANFTQVVGACTGDVVAMCDHDDVWFPERLATAVAVLEDPGVSAAFSDAVLIDAAGAPLPGRLWEVLSLDVRWLERADREETFRTLLARRFATGGTITLRGSVARAALPIASGWFQDEWLAQLASLQGRLVAIPTPLVAYRQHTGNAVGARADGLAMRVARAFDGRRRARLQSHLEQLLVLDTDFAARAAVPAWAREAVADRIAHVRARLAVEGGPLRRLRAVWREVRTGRYNADALRHWSAVQDLLG